MLNTSCCLNHNRLLFYVNMPSVLTLFVMDESLIYPLFFFCCVFLVSVDCWVCDAVIVNSAKGRCGVCHVNGAWLIWFFCQFSHFHLRTVKICTWCTSTSPESICSHMTRSDTVAVTTLTVGWLKVVIWCWSCWLQLFFCWNVSHLLNLPFLHYLT